MTFALTSEQILALAPDASSAKAGQGVSNPRKWASLGRDDRAIWGECQGSGKKPYQVQVDLSAGDLAYRCSCPSRKLPCKHTLGLLLLRASQPSAFSEISPPAWVSEWLDKRIESAQKRAARQSEAGTVSNPSARARRASTREANIRAGLEELDRWLSDLIRQGLASSQSYSATFWNTPATRMVDAQAPGVARRLRDLIGIEATGPGWQERLLERLALIHLLIEAYCRLDSLPDDIQADIRAAVGVTLKEADVLAGPELHDHWLILGQSVTEEDNLRVQRTWLWGQSSQRPALLLSFAAFKQPFEHSLVPGTALLADLVFYPSNLPLRALVKTSHAAPVSLNELPATPDINVALGGYAAALAANPWIERFPLALQDVVLIHANGSRLICDSAGNGLPLTPRFKQDWHLLALSGGYPFTLFGEWDGSTFLPLSAWIDHQFCVLSSES